MRSGFDFDEIQITSDDKIGYRWLGQSGAWPILT
jgi:hypothetical protein